MAMQPLRIRRSSASRHLGTMPAGRVADAGKLGRVRIDAAPWPQFTDRVATAVPTDHQRPGIIRVAPEYVHGDRIGLRLRVELQPAGELAVVVASVVDRAEHGPSAGSPR